ncbi:MAG: cell division protein SepF [Acidaminococcaceae bacterium]
MKIMDKLYDTLGIYEEEETTLETVEPVASPKRNFQAMREERKNLREQQARKTELSEERQSFFSRKKTNEDGKLISLPLAQKQVKVIVLEPAGFDDSQKVADYLRNNQPVVVNFETTDAEVLKRMTDFISGTVYALSGSMKKIGRNILVCAPQNVDIDAGKSIYDEKGDAPWKR